MKAFENSVLRRTFGPKMNDIMGECRKLHNMEVCNLHSSPNIIRQIKAMGIGWAGHVTHMGENRKVYKVLEGKPKEKRPIER
jgi:hypothetical protein